MSNEPKVITLATLAEASAQEVFDQVALHLLRQGRKSENGVYGCRYRYESPDWGILKCAAGCLIADNEYYPDFEKTAWETLVESEDVPAAHKELISHLQEIHDRSEVEKWPTNLAFLADQFGLIIPPCVVSMLKLQGAFHEPKI